MRKQTIKQIISILESIHEAQTERMFADCKFGTEALLNFISSINKEDTKTFELLQEYSTLIIKFENGEVNEKFMYKTIVNIINKVKSEFKPTRLEIAFISYKASMSDSIESIYFAAKDDPNCDAFFIPVPYYEVKENGSLGDLIYEGAEYYKNIEITNYKNYNIEERRPDIIFSFNPYDEANRITRVVSDYYFSNMRNYTEQLVYVPYMLSISLGPAELTYPGHILSTTTILWADLTRNNFLDNLKKAYKQNYSYFENKVLTIGSPKLDKVINTTKEDFPIPEDWSEIIADKKVVLYNSSIGNLLISGEAYLDKLEKILETFASNKEIALWWRPHPLLLQTFKSMLPDLLHRYLLIVKKYLENNTGIYDTTEDVTRVVHHADAYYGDQSSLIYLFSITGKPILIVKNHNYTITDNNTSFPKKTEAMKDIFSSFYLEHEGVKLENFLEYSANFAGEDILDEVNRKNKQIEITHNFFNVTDVPAGKKIYDKMKNKVLR